MKLYAPFYASPYRSDGNFENVFIQEAFVTRKPRDKYLSIKFEMFYMLDNIKQVIAETFLRFQGLENDQNTTYSPVKVSIPNPDFVEGSELDERIVVELPEYIRQNGHEPENMIIVDYGFYNYEQINSLIIEGTPENPEMIVTDPFCLEWFKNKIIMKDQKAVTQFDYIE